MIAVYKREMRSYFTTPIGYVFIAAFLVCSGFLYSLSVLQVHSSDVGTYFQLLMYAYIIMIPLLTMKSFAEEKKTHTEQLLLTSPISLWSMVTAKFLAALTMFLGTLALSAISFVTLGLYAEPNWAKLIGCLIGMIFIGICFIAIGLFMSSLTENQFVAALSTIAVLAGLMITSVLNSIINSVAVRTVLGWISIYSRFSNFTYGIFDIPAAIYYLSICGVFLFLCERVYEKRRYA